MWYSSIRILLSVLCLRAICYRMLSNTSLQAARKQHLHNLSRRILEGQRIGQLCTIG
ncbi:unnamed protein product [Albugo candida]|uniref:Uncharacterized protein n=1 Tax=Albugo candida TaxID=65357 RepID=A0A024G0T8_9STRA|nr:unnamed protein product [Albugo candida]|eukprot:CCI39905.1 unnamed protein product [Albugo candida]